MYRLTIVLLAAFDAVIAAVVGLAASLAPLTLLWVFGFDGLPDLGTLWPAAGTVWQLGHLVPLAITLPPEYVAAIGVDPAAASFPLSLAPLAFAGFTAVFAARSGRRAADAGSGLVGAGAGSVVFAAIATLVAMSARTDVAVADPALAIVLPALVFAVPAVVAAIAAQWDDADAGPVAVVRDRLERARAEEAVRATAAGVAVIAAAVVGLGGLVVAAAVIAGMGEVISLTQAAGVDLVGSLVLALGSFLYLPTLWGWGVAFAAGPGFTLGEGTAIAPGGTDAGIVPGIPILGLLPSGTSPWLLLLGLLPVGVGALAGLIVRRRLRDGAVEDAPVATRAIVAGALGLLTAGIGALLAVVTSGGIGPGRFERVGPEPGPLALALGLEVVVGAAILLLSPRGLDGDETVEAYRDEDRGAFDRAPASVVFADPAPDPADDVTEDLSDLRGSGGEDPPR
ncbi:cell division protein PerM [Microbacterium aurantiacum]|uniref:cell division protein PerM n=5 Tax=Microbacterium aurantiacum TaxID=162393 RepID=UPI004035AE6C